MNRRFPISIGPGIVDDDTVTAINTGNWADASLVRFWRGLAQTINGWETNTTDTFSGICRGMFAWRDNAGLLNIAIGTHTGLYVWNDGTLYNITPADEAFLLEDGDDLLLEDGTAFLLESTFTAGNVDGYGGAGYGTGAYGTGDYGSPTEVDAFPLTWSFYSFGEALIACPRGQAVYIWNNNTAAPAVRVSGAPTRNTWVAVTKERQIICYGTLEEVSGVYNPRCIRWSDFETTTTWTTTATNNAGEYILESAGRVVSARKTAQGFFVWTEAELFFQTFLGDPSQTFLFQRQGTGCGLIGPNAATVSGSTAYWVTPGVEFLTAGIGAEPQGLQSPLRRELFDNLAPVQQEKIYAATLSRFNEVWWFYPDVRDGDGLECSRAVCVSTVGNGWMKHQLARTAYIDSNPMEYATACDPSGYIYWHEKGTSANGGVMNAFAETGDIRMSEGASVMLMRGMWPDFDDQVGSVSLTVRTKLYPQDSYVSFGPYALAVGATKRDFMASGRFISLKLESNTAPTFWRASPFNVEGTIRGQR